MNTFKIILGHLLLPLYFLKEESEYLLKTLQLYSLTLIYPLLISALLFVGLILGLDFRTSFLESVVDIWDTFYISGVFLLTDVPAYRWHLLILICCYLYSKFE